MTSVAWLEELARQTCHSLGYSEEEHDWDRK